LAVDVDLRAQAVKGGPAKGAPRRQVTYRGISPGLTSMEEVREKIGKPVHRAKWYAWKLLYEPVGPAAKRVRAKESGLFDSFHLLGSPEDGHIGTIEAVSVPDGYETEAKIRAKLGDPELKLTHAGGQVLLDYSSKGVRFTLDPNYRTIGTAYFPHGYSRVHDGCRREIDLSHLRQGPTLRAKNPPKPNLKAGAAEIDISPTDPKWFKDEFTIHDAMKARCVVFERDGQKVAIVGADLFGMLKSEFDPIEAELKKKVGLTALIVGMSHNHAAPDTIGIYGYYPKDYVAHIQTQIEKVVTEALAKLEDVEEVAVSSDELLLTGARVHGLMRNARNPGIVDPQIALVEARGKGGKPIATLLHFACHPEGLEKGAKEISADFPGYLCERWKKETGAQAIFLNGALGGMVSGDTKARTHAEAKAAGKAFADALLAIRTQAAPSQSDHFKLQRQRIEVPVTNPKLLIFQRMSGNRRPYYRGRVVSEMFHLRIGEAEIVTIPGELLPEISFEILEKMKGYPRMIVGLVNDELGYMVPGYDYRAGAYEEGMSVSPAVGPMVKEAALRLVGE